MERDYDIVLFGATGFTGGLTAAYLAAHAPAEARIALAGRSPEKLEQVRSALAQETPAAAGFGLVLADSSDPSSLDALAASTRVVITTVGPYLQYGEGLVAACAAAGTDYVDLTGEPEFVDLMYIRYHEQARKSGARLIHACGFDSIPHDLGVFWTLRQFDPRIASEKVSVEGFVAAKGSLSGGTYHSAVTVMGRIKEAGRVSRQRRSLERHAPDGQLTEGRSVRSGELRIHKEPVAGGWVVPVPLIDPQIVMRSARLIDSYGREFTYSHYIVTRRLTTTAGLGAGVGFIAMMAQLKRTRKLILKFKRQGSGPSAAKRAKSRFRVRFIATVARPGEQGYRRMVTEVTGGDPGYGETSKMLAESALALAFDKDLPEVGGGQLTTAYGIGAPLLRRIQAAGIGFAIVSDETE
jgi:short subunit dehydrogenase-like uncharacterized protein